MIRTPSRAYYEDIYYDIALDYLTNFDSKLILFEDKLEVLRDLQSFYDSFTTNLMGEINDQSGIRLTLSQLHQSIVLFIVALLADIVFTATAIVATLYPSEVRRRLSTIKTKMFPRKGTTKSKKNKKK